MIHKPEVIIGNTQEEAINGIVKVLKLYAEINSMAKITSKAVKLKMSQHINSLQSNEALKSNIQNIWGHLSEKQRK
jgi:hypothetical protein